MRHLIGLAAALTASALMLAGLAGQADAAPAATARLTLTGLNRAGQVVPVTSATLLGTSGRIYSYAGTPLQVRRGTYLIAAGVPGYAGSSVTSETLVYRKVSKTETIRLNGSAGHRLTVSLSGVQAALEDLSADVCLSTSPDGAGFATEASVTGGPGVAVYAVPVRSANLAFNYLAVLQSPAGPAYYLNGAGYAGRVPASLTYRQQVAGLAKLTLTLRSGAYGSAEDDWVIQSSGTACDGGQAGEVTQPEKLVSYLSPGRWTAEVDSYSLGTNGDLYRAANGGTEHRFQAGRSYSYVFGAAVAGPGADYPVTSDDYRHPSRFSLLQYGAGLFTSPDGGTDAGCCWRAAVTLRLGAQVVKAGSVSWKPTSVFLATLRKSGWYTLTASASRSFQGGNTPAGLLSPRVAVSYRFHASATPAGNGAQQNMPLTDVQYQALGLNLANQAAPGGTTTLNIRVLRPWNAGVATPVYRLKHVLVYVSDDGGATWQLLPLTRSGGMWRGTVHDPGTGYVSIRSIVTDVHGDRTKQTVYRAYSVS
jgi:hypothetical protein